MKRRNFLQATLATAGAVIAGCDGSDTESTAGTTTTGTPRTLEDGAQFFPQSVASGDPRPGSVILWTRLFDEGSTEDLALSLELSPDADFSEYISLDGQQSIPLTAQAAFDYCVKVRLAGISAATVYYYRFIYEKGGKFYTSKIGRTKTAPADTADVSVKFAFVSCQDYIGRFYNTYSRLLKEPLDFVVHLGDYVYETTGDPTFQNTTGRAVEFSDKASALELTAGSGEKYYAAKSLSNYRDLYKIYRSDAVLQKVHETFPMIATWDDHEFSDDCHGAVASYLDGKADETDVDRRKAANQAWFEYMPVDYLGDPEFRYDATKEFPGDIKIWRDFGYGKHMHLVMTDLRSFRADHIIPEDAFPGTVVVDEAALIAEYTEIPADAKPYVDIDDAQWAAHKAAITAATEAGGGDVTKITGNISVAFINVVVSQINGGPPVIDDAMQMDLPKGIAYIDVGKGSFYTSIGSRYFVIKPTFDILARIAYKTAKKNQDVMGSEQESWFLSTVKGSTRTWKVWGNEYCVTPLMIDLSGTLPVEIPPAFKHVFYMNCDAWDGFNNKRDELLTQLSAESNVVVITGDIHASYAGTPWVSTDNTKKIVEFVGSSISSGTFKSLLTGQVAADPVLSGIDGAEQLAGAIDTLFGAGPNNSLGFMDSVRNGFVVADLSATEFVATYYRIAEKEVSVDHSASADLDGLFKVATYKTIAGGHDLYEMQEDGKYLKWNPETKAFE